MVLLKPKSNVNHPYVCQTWIAGSTRQNRAHRRWRHLPDNLCSSLMTHMIENWLTQWSSDLHTHATHTPKNLEATTKATQDWQKLGTPVYFRTPVPAERAQEKQNTTPRPSVKPALTPSFLMDAETRQGHEAVLRGLNVPSVLLFPSCWGDRACDVGRYKMFLFYTKTKV